MVTFLACWDLDSYSAEYCKAVYPPPLPHTYGCHVSPAQTSVSRSHSFSQALKKTNAVGISSSAEASIAFPSVETFEDNLLCNAHGLYDAEHLDFRVDVAEANNAATQGRLRNVPCTMTLIDV